MIEGILKGGVFANIKINFSGLRYFNYDKQITCVRMKHIVVEKCNFRSPVFENTKSSTLLLWTATTH